MFLSFLESQTWKAQCVYFSSRLNCFFISGNFSCIISFQMFPSSFTPPHSSLCLLFFGLRPHFPFSKSVIYASLLFSVSPFLAGCFPLSSTSLFPLFFCFSYANCYIQMFSVLLQSWNYSHLLLLLLSFWSVPVNSILVMYFFQSSYY